MRKLLQVNVQRVNELTMLVGLYQKNIYRCMTCGADLEQHVNGKISYIPALNERYTLQI